MNRILAFAALLAFASGQQSNHQRDLSEQQQLLHNAQHAAELQALAARTVEDATSTTLTAAAQHQEQAINDLKTLLR